MKKEIWFLKKNYCSVGEPAEGSLTLRKIHFFPPIFISLEKKIRGGKTFEKKCLVKKKKKLKY